MKASLARWRALAGVSAAVSLALATAACALPDECRARGHVSTYEGVTAVSFSTGDGDGGPTSAEVSEADGGVVVDDYTPDCIYDDETFPVTVNGCTLTLQAGDTSYDQANVFVQGSGSLASVTACDLQLGSDTASVLVQTAFFGEEGTFQLEVAGSLVAWNGAPRTGTFDLSFTGATE